MIPAIVVLVLGLATAAAAYVQLADVDRRFAEELANRQADWRLRTITETFDRTLLALEIATKAIEAAAGQSEAADAAIITALADYQRSNAFIGGVYWAPRVTREQLPAVGRTLGQIDPDLNSADVAAEFHPASLDDREEYFIAEAGTEFGDDQLDLGSAVLSHPLLRAATRAAIASKSPAATPLVRWDRASGDVYGYYVVAPVFDRSDSVSQTDSGRIRGFVVTSQVALERRLDSRVDGLLVTSYRSNAGLKRALTEAPAPLLGVQFLGPVWTAAGRVQEQVIATLDPILDRFLLDDADQNLSTPVRLSRSFDFIGQTWTIEFSLPDETFAGMRSSSAPAWFASIVFATLALSGYIGRTQYRVAAVETLAGQRAAALRQASNDLDLEAAARSAAELEARSSESRLQAIIANSPIGIAVTNTHRVVEIWNRAAESIFKYPEKDALWRPLSEIVDRILIEDRLDAPVGRTQTIMTEQVRIKDGSLILVRHHSAPIIEDNGEIHGEVHLYRDITAEIATEQRLRQAQKMEAVGQLTSGLAHDFNNLLAVVSANLDLLDQLVHDHPDARKRLNGIRRATKSGARLTRRLLSFARMQNLALETVDIGAVLDEQAVLLRRTLGEQIIIEFAADNDLWPVRADADELATAITNLAVNARDAMPDGGRLSFRLSNVSVAETTGTQMTGGVRAADLTPGDYVKLDVADTGTGMTAETADKIFMPFFTTKAEGQGTGLGLAMVFGFIKQIGGGLAVESTLGTGTTFSLYFPRAKNSRQDAGAGPLISAPAEPTRNIPALTILIVDDNAGVREATADLMCSMGYKAIVAANGEEALRAIETRLDIDLLFTDMIMPGDYDGKRLAQAARRIRPGLKVVFSSGFIGGTLDDGCAIEAGPNDPPAPIVLNKPFSRKDLAEVIGRLFGA